MGAIASGNKQAFDEAVREYNQNFGLQTDQFNESVRQFNQNFGVTQAGLTGTYQGAPTQQAIAQAANLAAQTAGLTGYYVAPNLQATGGGATAGGGTWTAPTQDQYVQARTQQLVAQGMPQAQAQQTAGSEWTQGLAQSGNVAYGLPSGISFSAPAAGAAPSGGGDAASYVAARTAQLQQVAGMPAAQAAQTAQAEWAQGMAQSGNVAYGLPAGWTPGGTPAAGGTAAGPQGTPTMQLQAQWANLYGQNGAPAAGQQTLANIAQQNQIAQNWANIYGYTPQFDANGQPIIQGGQNAQTLAAQQQAYAQQLGAINAAAALQANPFRQQQVIGQLGRVLGGQGVAGFSAPNTVQGVGTQGGNTQGGFGYMNQLIADIQNPGANQSSVQSVLDGIPTPNKINSADFLRSSPSTQNMILQGMQEKYGLDPNDSLAQIKNTLPAFQAPSTFGSIKG